MNGSYRRGVVIVLGTILWSAVLHLTYSLLLAKPSEANAPAARDFTATDPALGPFQLTDSSRRTISEADLADRVWIAAFIFTRCPSSCPRITATMRGLQDKLGGSNVGLVSISVDPAHDTPEVLARYAESNGADPQRWWFLTGPRDYVYDLILKRFRLPIAESTAADLERGAEAVLHSDRLVLVDRGNRVVGYYSSDEADGLVELLDRAQTLDTGRWVRRLPAVNAMLNSSCALALMVGWILIRTGRTRGHIASMVTALVVSALFLTCYLIYHFQVGSVPFRGTGPVRSVYFTILLSHTILAAAVVPLVVMTVIRAVRQQYAAHASLARITFPIWLYVSITGVVIFLMLYHLPVAPPATPLG